MSGLNTKTVLLTGAEASAKTSLSLAFASESAVVVGEYVREFLDKERRDSVYSDVDLIAKEQLKRENIARSSGKKLAIFDTNLLSNLLYSKLLFGKAPSWIEPALIRSNYDHIVLLDPIGIEWKADGQRCLDSLEKRVEFFGAIKQWLETHKKPYQIVGGSYDDRLRTLQGLLSATLYGT